MRRCMQVCRNIRRKVSENIRKKICGNIQKKVGGNIHLRKCLEIFKRKSVEIFIRKCSLVRPEILPVISGNNEKKSGNIRKRVCGIIRKKFFCGNIRKKVVMSAFGFNLICVRLVRPAILPGLYAW